MPTPTHFRIDITSDAPCPWCYIGYTLFLRGLHIFTKTYSSTSTFDIKFHPYQLHPEYPRSSDSSAQPVAARESLDGVKMPSVTLRETLDEKLEGQMSHSKSFVGVLERVGKGAGIGFSWKGRMGWTGWYHVAVEWAGRIDGERKEKGELRRFDEMLQHKIVIALFEAFFEGEGVDVTSAREVVDTIGGILGDEGMEKREVEEELLREEALASVLVKSRGAKEKGMVGVPNFKIRAEGKEKVWEVSGAQDVEEWMELLIRIAESGGEVGEEGEVEGTEGHTLCRVVDGKMTCAGVEELAGLQTTFPGCCKKLKGKSER